MALPPNAFSYVLVGAGRVGTAVALLLKKAGHRPIAVSSRTRASAEAAAARLGCSAVDRGERVYADVYLIGTGLDAIPEVAEQLAAGGLGSKFVCHFAGAAGIEPLRSVIDRGGFGCAMHPVQACPDVATAVARLPGSAWGITCSDGAAEWASGMVERDLAGYPVRVGEADRSLWHAAAVVTSNGIAALIATGETLLREIGVDEPEKVLGPIAVGTAQNARDGGGGAKTLTGPIVRGETDTVARHIASLRDRPHDIADAYRLASSLIMMAAHRAGRIDAVTLKEMHEALQ